MGDGSVFFVSPVPVARARRAAPPEACRDAGAGAGGRRAHTTEAFVKTRGESDWFEFRKYLVRRAVPCAPSVPALDGRFARTQSMRGDAVRYLMEFWV